MGRFDEESLTPEEEEARRRALGLSLPAVVTGPGDYVTRSGLTARVVKVHSGSSGGDYPCHGSILHPSGDRPAAGLERVTWTAAGFYRAGGGHPYDIVGPR